MEEHLMTVMVGFYLVKGTLRFYFVVITFAAGFDCSVTCQCKKECWRIWQLTNAIRKGGRDVRNVQIIRLKYEYDNPPVD